MHLLLDSGAVLADRGVLVKSAAAERGLNDYPSTLPGRESLFCEVRKGPLGTKDNFEPFRFDKNRAVEETRLIDRHSVAAESCELGDQIVFDAQTLGSCIFSNWDKRSVGVIGKGNSVDCR